MPVPVPVVDHCPSVLPVEEWCPSAHRGDSSILEAEIHHDFPSDALALQNSARNDDLFVEGSNFLSADQNSQ